MEKEKFAVLIRDLLKVAELDVEFTSLDDIEFLSFVHEGMTCRVVPHPTNDLVLVEVDLLPVDRVPPEAGFKALLLLHQINTAARFTSQIMASISVDDILLISKVYDGRYLEGGQLAAEMAMMLEAAPRLKDAWTGILDAESSETRIPAGSGTLGEPGGFVSPERVA